MTVMIVPPDELTVDTVVTRLEVMRSPFPEHCLSRIAGDMQNELRQAGYTYTGMEREDDVLTCNISLRVIGSIKA